jgi:hypothetical protein
VSLSAKRDFDPQGPQERLGATKSAGQSARIMGPPGHAAGKSGKSGAGALEVRFVPDQ